jgi:hypothetical protein
MRVAIKTAQRVLGFGVLAPGVSTHDCVEALRRHSLFVVQDDKAEGEAVRVTIKTTGGILGHGVLEPGIESRDCAEAMSRQQLFVVPSAGASVQLDDPTPAPGEVLPASEPPRPAKRKGKPR